MDFFEKEMRTMFDGNTIIQEPQFFGKTLLGRLDDDLRIKLEFISSGVQNCYFSMQMSVFNRNQGLVDKTIFPFSDVLGMYQCPGCQPMPHHIIVECCDAKWFTPITEAQKQLYADRVLAFAEMYLDPAQSLENQFM